MRLLLVEDDPEKRNDAKKLLELEFGEHEIVVAASFVVARDHLLSGKPFDVAVLDVTLPQRADEQATTSAPTREGEDLIRDIDAWERPTLAIVFSGIDRFADASTDGMITSGELERLLQRTFPKVFWGWVRYRGNDAWREQLRTAVHTALLSFAKKATRTEED